MKNNRWLLVVMGVVALGMAVTFGAVFGAGVTYFLFQAEPAQAAFSVPEVLENEHGVLISGIKPESAAADAGLVRGDIILEINGEPVNDVIEIKAVLSDFEPGDVVDVNILHGDDTRFLEIELDDGKGFAILGVGTCDFPNKMPFKGGPMSDEFIETLLLGAEIVEIVSGSPAEEAGLLVGDLIISVNDKSVGFETDLADLIHKYTPGDLVVLEVISGIKEDPRKVEITLSENPDQPGQAFLGVAYEYENLFGEFQGEKFPHIEMFPFEKLPEGWEEHKDFYFHHDEDMDGEHPEGWVEEDEFFFHDDDISKFSDLSGLPEDIVGLILIVNVLEDTPAAEAGLAAGDFIIEVEGEPIEDIDAFIDDLKSRKPGEEIPFTVIKADVENDATTTLNESEVTVTLTEHPDDPQKGFLGVMVESIIMIEGMEPLEGFGHDFDFELPNLPGGDT